MKIQKKIRRRSVNEEFDLDKDVYDVDTEEPIDSYVNVYNKPAIDDVFGDEVYDTDDEDIDDNQEPEEDTSSVDINDKNIKNTLVNMLRAELQKKECYRDYLRFRYRGEICDGVPMSEINPSKFVFKIDKKLKAVNLSEIKIL